MLQRLEQGRVVPVVGQDLLAVNDGGRETLLYPLLARRLAERLGLTTADLPPGGELEEVARRYVTKPHDVAPLYRHLRAVFRELDTIPIPPPLVNLARISSFKLYVTTTFDVLTERAIDHERFGGQRQTLAFAYAPNDKQDLPPEFDRLNRPAVFHLMGRLSGTPHSYALTGEDTLEFMRSLQARTEDSPGFLFDKLRTSDLLIMGSHFAEWLARLVIEDTRGRHLIEAELQGDAHSRSDGNQTPVLFLRHSHGETEVWRLRGSVDFVHELHRRWTEIEPTRAPGPPPPAVELASSPEIQTGFVFMSSARADLEAAESIRSALDGAGVDVILDSDDVPLADRWENRLRGYVDECCLFLPVVSAHSLTASRRFFRAEWIEAILEASEAVPGERFILPVAIDDIPPGKEAMPEEFGELDWESLPGGKPTGQFVDTVVQLQRSYRRVRFA